jgi:hypothetical protein
VRADRAVLWTRAVDCASARQPTIRPSDQPRRALGADRRADVQHFAALERLGVPVGPGGVICLAEQPLPLTASNQSIPAWMDWFDAARRLSAAA